MRFCANSRTPRVFQDVCRCTALLNSILAPQLVLPSSSHYQSLVNHHYTLNAPLQPGCFFQPKSSEQVGLGVSILVEADDGSPECQFAIRGGGHTPFMGAAGVEGGVTIDLAMMSQTIYDPTTSTVSIMTGARWGDVYTTLKPLGVAVTGGRSDSVGVGGLIIGGGWSYFAPQHGLACDNVVNFEIVLSNGTPTTANKTHNPLLFRALKGSGNNLGILTRVTLRAFPQGPLWGGIILHPATAIPSQITAIVNFTPALEVDPHANLVTIWQHKHDAENDVGFAASGLQHTLATADAEIFNEFLTIERSGDTLRVADIYDLMMETAPPPGMRAVFLTLTFRNEARVLEKLAELHEEAVKSVKAGKVVSEEWDVISFLQPFPAVLEKVSREARARGGGGNMDGGNVLGLERMGGEDHLLYLLFLDWLDEADDDLFHDLGYDLIDKLKAYTQEIGADSDYVYMNYAGRDQNPLKGYGDDNLQFIAAMARKYDPIEVFQRQVPGGFKVSKAHL
ncbi:hypothetical protein BJY04DRAFT_207140 [Aspergillus karnatakaensis]|uniref:FAD-binding oxidoreductase n=1 Tax=Aspergillus karnatakaensis TaxID=1810916 RepID=UPI003CCDF410